FRVPDETPQVLVYLVAGEAPPASAGARPATPIGTDLVIRDLYNGAPTTIGEVSDFAISKSGAWLAYGVVSKTPARDGAFARGLGNGARKTLMAGEGNYKSFTFDAEGKQAAFISDHDESKVATPIYKLYRWVTSADRATEIPVPVGPALTVSEHGRVEFSKDG